MERYTKLTGTRIRELMYRDKVQGEIVWRFLNGLHGLTEREAVKRLAESAVDGGWRVETVRAITLGIQEAELEKE